MFGKATRLQLIPGFQAAHLAGLCLACVFLSTTLLSLVTAERLKRIHLAGKMVSVQSFLRGLTPTEMLLGGTAAAAAILLGTMELRYRGIQRFLAMAPPPLLLTVLGCAGLWFSHALLAPGLLVTGDAGSHVSRVAHLMAALKGGDSLVWDNYYFAGGPFLQFTGPVFHWLAASIGLACGDATTGVKIVVVCLRLAAMMLMYAFLRRLGLARAAAFLGALFYGGSFVETYLLSIRSSFPQILNLAMLPAVFLCFEGVISAERAFGVNWLWLCLASVIFVGNHQPTAVLAGLYVTAYGIARYCQGVFKREKFYPLALACIAIAIGSICFVIPFLFEKAFTADNFLPQLIGMQTPAFMQMLSWGQGGAGRNYTAYLGLSVMACFLAGGLVAQRSGVTKNTGRLWVLFAALTLTSIFLTAHYIRDIIFTLFALSAAAAISVQAWQEAYPSLPHIPALAGVAFLLDVGPTAVQPWSRTDMRAVAKAGDYLAANMPDRRVLEVDFTKTGPVVPIGPGVSPLLYARVQSLYGPHKMDATPAHNALAAVSKLVEARLAKSGAPGPVEIGLLSQYNVGWIVGVNGPRVGLPAAWNGTDTNSPAGKVIRLTEATPILTSARLEYTDVPAGLGGAPLWSDDFPAGRGAAAERDVVAAWQKMQVNLPARQAATFLVTGARMEAASHPAHQDRVAPRAELAFYSVQPGKVDISVESDRDGFVRLAHPFYPTTAVLRDGQPMKPLADIFGLMVLPLHTGHNHYDIVAGASLLRLVCFWISATMTFSLLVVVLACHAGRARRR